MKFTVTFPQEIKNDGDDKVIVTLTKGLEDEPLVGDALYTSILLEEATEEMIEETAKQLLQQYIDKQNEELKAAANLEALQDKKLALSAQFSGEVRLDDPEINPNP